MNAFRQGIEQSRTLGTIALSLSATSLVSTSVLIPKVPPEFRVFIGGAGVAAGAIAFATQKEQRSWQQISSNLELSTNTLLISGCLSLSCAATIPNKSENPLNLLTIGSSMVAIASAKKAAIASSSIAGLVEEEMAIGFGQEFDRVTQQSTKPVIAQLPPTQAKPVFVQQEVSIKASGRDTHLGESVAMQAIEQQSEERAIAVLEPSVKTQYQTINYQEQEDDTFYSWSRDLLGYPAALIYGPQGAGKTSFASWLVGERLKLGHKIIVLDPHREYGQWEGLKCVGDGMNYGAINRELGWFTKEIKRRYEERAIIPNYTPNLITVLCDEFTGWSAKCENSADFFRESLSDIRKVGMHVIFISHARTMTGLGGAKGLAQTRDTGLFELELEATVDPLTKKAKPKMQGKLKYPGTTEREVVAIAPWMKGQTDFRGLVAPSLPEQIKKVEEISENLLDRHFTNKVEFVANERDRFDKFRLSLPTHPGVYCVSDGTTIYYVGYSKNVARRWMRTDKKHHWIPAILELLNQGKKIFIYSKIVSAEVEQVERDLIEKLQPLWNGKDPIREVREMRQKQQAIAPATATQTQIEVTEEERQQILDCKAQGLNQDGTIYKIWGVHKSGSDKKYLSCREKYQFTIKDC